MDERPYEFFSPPLLTRSLLAACHARNNYQIASLICVYSGAGLLGIALLSIGSWSAVLCLLALGMLFTFTGVGCALYARAPLSEISLWIFIMGQIAGMMAIGIACPVPKDTTFGCMTLMWLGCYGFLWPPYRQSAGLVADDAFMDRWAAKLAVKEIMMDRWPLRSHRIATEAAVFYAFKCHKLRQSWQAFLSPAGELYIRTDGGASIPLPPEKTEN